VVAGRSGCGAAGRCVRGPVPGRGPEGCGPVPGSRPGRTPGARLRSPGSGGGPGATGPGVRVRGPGWGSGSCGCRMVLQGAAVRRPAHAGCAVRRSRFFYIYNKTTTSRYTRATSCGREDISPRGEEKVGRREKTGRDEVWGDAPRARTWCVARSCFGGEESRCRPRNNAAGGVSPPKKIWGGTISLRPRKRGCPPRRKDPNVWEYLPSTLSESESPSFPLGIERGVLQEVFEFKSVIKFPVRRVQGKPLMGKFYS